MHVHERILYCYLLLLTVVFQLAVPRKFLFVGGVIGALLQVLLIEDEHIQSKILPILDNLLKFIVNILNFSIYITKNFSFPPKSTSFKIFIV